ncbi:MAG: hypothetical protein LBH96_04990 [Candidatus Peribacteria bacterium]|nr:hypothetical protein [Candidatus Peribacteria bacterium]
MNEYQQNLYLNAEIVQAFEGFTNNTYIKENFLKFVRESNPTASEEEAIQAMKEFLTSDMFEETLVQMFNRQVDNKDKGVAYFQENMYYRAKVRQQYIKIEKSDLTQEDIEKNKRDIFNATIFLRQKTNIINETK